jgi:hypothetical protein
MIFSEIQVQFRIRIRIHNTGYSTVPVYRYRHPEVYVSENLLEVMV